MAEPDKEKQPIENQEAPWQMFTDEMYMVTLRQLLLENLSPATDANRQRDPTTIGFHRWVNNELIHLHKNDPPLTTYLMKLHALISGNEEPLKLNVDTSPGIDLSPKVSDFLKEVSEVSGGVLPQREIGEDETNQPIDDIELNLSGPQSDDEARTGRELLQSDENAYAFLAGAAVAHRMLRNIVFLNHGIILPIPLEEKLPAIKIEREIFGYSLLLEREERELGMEDPNFYDRHIREYEKMITPGNRYTNELFAGFLESIAQIHRIATTSPRLLSENVLGRDVAETFGILNNLRQDVGVYNDMFFTGAAHMYCLEQFAFDNPEQMKRITPIY